MKSLRFGTVWCAAALLTMSGPASLQGQSSGTAQDPSSHNRRDSSDGRRNGRMIRGSVTGTGTNSVTIKTDAGEVWTVQTTDNTRLMKQQQTVKVADVKAGDEVMAFGVPDAPAHQLHAMMVGVVDAATAAKARADMGKTYIVGHITAIDETRLTIMRPDRVTQTIAVDETTSFHRGGRMNLDGMGFGPGMGGGGRRNGNEGGPRADENGESITLADVKVGDNIGGTGSIKNGMFVPTDLRIQMRRPHGEGESMEQGAAPPQP